MPEDYLLLPESSPIVPEVLEAVRDWLRGCLPVPALEVADDLWYLFDEADMREAARRRLAKRPGATLAAYAVIRLRPTHFQLVTVRDPVTDRALYAFALWCSTRFACQLYDVGRPIEPDYLINPELYG